MLYLTLTKFMENQRDWVVSELENIFKLYGNFVQKTSVEIETQLFDKARHAEEYMSLARRLLRTLTDTGKQRQGKSDATAVPLSRPPPFGDTGRNPFRSIPRTSGVTGGDNGSALVRPPLAPLGRPQVLLSTTPMDSTSPPATVLSRGVFLSPSVPVLATTTTTALPSANLPSSESDATLQRPPYLPPRDVIYETVRLPAPNKRTFVQAIGSRKTAYGQRTEESRQVEEEPIELVTRLEISGIGDGHFPQENLTDVELSQDTFEAAYKFLVPRNSVIKQITIHLKKLR
ncbi:hypothetical protein BV898_00935 [Hypsibius exemplaris]|uniref:Mediator of RNA polymerase II transcription subunit 15 n=1 Tax=Hypsibius exemplaris TaxID=2072580 RepID=A0A1W0XCR5_HYPEX|nr:hypothetical protein BV898_00935 [Hypsibius exemplaris]